MGSTIVPREEPLKIFAKLSQQKHSTSCFANFEWKGEWQQCSYAEYNGRKTEPFQENDCQRNEFFDAAACETWHYWWDCARCQFVATASFDCRKKNFRRTLKSSPTFTSNYQTRLTSTVISLRLKWSIPRVDLFRSSTALTSIHFLRWLLMNAALMSKTLYYVCRLMKAVVSRK